MATSASLKLTNNYPNLRQTQSKSSSTILAADSKLLRQDECRIPSADITKCAIKTTAPRVFIFERPSLGGAGVTPPVTVTGWYGFDEITDFFKQQQIIYVYVGRALLPILQATVKATIIGPSCNENNVINVTLLDDGNGELVY